MDAGKNKSSRKEKGYEFPIFMIYDRRYKIESFTISEKGTHVLGAPDEMVLEKFTFEI